MEREGGDITAADMIPRLTEPSQIERHFAGRVVFVTGGTGFLGRLLVEKLLRTCSNVKKIYILLRSKKGKCWQERFQEYFEGPLYERLKREKPETVDKVEALMGDCSLPDLGLSEADQNVIFREVDSIFHFATCLCFNYKLKEATNVNVRCTRDLLKMARNIWELRSIVCLSTTSSFYPRQIINEEFYEPPIDYKKLLSLVDSLSEQNLEFLTPVILEKWPNPAAFTMAVAEDVVKNSSDGLPVTLIRPSMVIGTSKEPMVGWMKSVYGISGFFAGVSLGVIRTLHCELNNKADLVPADYVVNAAIAAAWDIANTKKFNENSENPREIHEKYDSGVPIYNYVNSCQNYITWDACFSLTHHHIQNIPTCLEVWYYFFLAAPNRFIFAILHNLLHLVPAFLIDFMGFFIGIKYKHLQKYRKIKKFLDSLSHYTSQQWTYRDCRTQKLWNKLNEEDRKHFEFNICGLDWDLYFHTFARGSRVYLLQDPLETIPEGARKRQRLKLLHYGLVLSIVLGLGKIVQFIWNFQL